MQNIIIWIDSSIKLENKLIKLNEFLLNQFQQVLFVSKDLSTAKFYKSKGFNIISIEENIDIFKEQDILNYDDLMPNEIDKEILSSIINFYSFKKNSLPNYVLKEYSDSSSQLSILGRFWSFLISKNNISHGLVLNGISINAFSLSLCLYKNKKNTIFWENGLIPGSLFINKSGVNAFSFIESYENNNLLDEKIYKLEEIIHLFSRDLINNPSILITLQVNTDTNIKCFSPFFGVRDFVLFLNNEFKNKFYRKFDLFLRSHPKYNFDKRKYKFLLKNFIFSSLSFEEDIDRSTLVITINSTTGLEAILNKKGLISFGNSYYSKFLRFKYIAYMGYKIKVFIFNPKNKIDISNRDKILSSLKDNSLLLNDNYKQWSKVFNKVQNTDTNPFFVLNEFNQFIYKNKIISFPKKNNIRFQFFKKYIVKILNRFNLI